MLLPVSQLFCLCISYSCRRCLCIIFAHYVYLTPFINASLQTATYSIPGMKILILRRYCLHSKHYYGTLNKVPVSHHLCPSSSVCITHNMQWLSYRFLCITIKLFLHELKMEMYTWPQLTATVGKVLLFPPLWYCLSCSRKLCLTSSVTPDLHCWEATSGERQTRTMAARAIGKVGSIVITCNFNLAQLVLYFFHCHQGLWITGAVTIILVVCMCVCVTIY